MKLKKIAEILFVLILCAVSTVGVFIASSLSVCNGPEWLLDFLASHRLSWFICWGLFCGLYFVWKRHIHKVSCAAVIPAVLFSAISVVEGCLKDPVTWYCASLKAFVLAFAGCLVLYILVLELIYWGIDRILSSARGSFLQNEMAYDNAHRCWKTLLYGCCILLLWSPWMVLCFPGNMNADTGTSILFHLGLDRTNVNNPFFQNFIFGMTYRLGCLLGNVDIGFFLYLLCQSTLIAMLLGTSISFVEYLKAPWGWRIALLALYGLCPYFPLYAITVGKDSNFTIVVLAFATLLTNCMLQGDRFPEDRKKILLLSGLVILMGLLKNHGKWIGIGCLTVCGIRYAIQTKRIPKMLCIGIAAILLITSLLPAVLGVPKTETRESMALPLQQTARYVLNYDDEITDEEREIIDAVIPYEWLSHYNPIKADPVKVHVRKDATTSDWIAYFQLWLKHFLTHPRPYLKAFYFQTYGYYSTDAVSGAMSMRKWGYDIKPVIFDLTEIKPTHDVDKLHLAMKIDEWAMNVPLLGKFQKIGIYTWILIASIAYLLSRKKAKWLICLLPSIIIMVGCCFTAVNGYPRYALSAVVMIPIISSSVLFASNVEKTSA